MTEISATNFEQPHWETQSTDVDCPLCDYNLRGLIEPRCPECGYQFTWPDLLDPSHGKHAYLFEHHPKQTFRSFWRTAFHTLRPMKFWKSVRARHECVVPRLRLYFLIIAVIFLAALASNVGVIVLNHNAQLWGTVIPSTATNTITFGSSRSGGFVPVTPPSPRPPPPVLVPPFSFEWPDHLAIGSYSLVVVVVLAWPWLTFNSLHLLRVSMKRAKIRSGHILRCVVYSWDIVLWASILTLIVNISESVLILGSYLTKSPTMSSFVPHSDLIGGGLVLWTILIPIFIYRLLVAYTLYPRFRHAIAVVLLTQVIVVLMVGIVVVCCV